MIFNRFARETRRCVKDAVEEARMLGHDSIGDEDLLLGILHADEGVAAEALSSFGVTLEEARDESEGMLSDALSSIGISLEEVRREAGDAFDMSISEDRRIPFSPRAKKVLERALREAARLRDSYLGAEHVLMGVLRDGHGTAVRMLARLDVVPEMLEERLYEVRGRPASGLPPYRRRMGDVKTRSAKTRTLLASGVISGPLFVVAFLVEGATRANYDPLRHPVSSLALGDYGWMQVTNFIVVGLLTLAFSAGLRRTLRPGKGSTLGPSLVGVWAVGLLGAGVFVTDPVSGYPPGAPDRLSGYSWHGALHDLFSLAAFVALAAACFVFGRRFAARGERGWAIYSSVSGLVFVVAFVISNAGFGQAQGIVDLAGLLQRVAVAIGFGWLTLLAVHLLRGMSPEHAELAAFRVK